MVGFKKQFLYILVPVFLLLLGVQISLLKDISNKTSPLADGYSESNAIRAGASYNDLGFLKNAGLPDICYGTLFQEIGSKKGRESCVYTHYPPLPDISVGIMSVICGNGNTDCFRALPVTFNILLYLVAFLLIFMIFEIKVGTGVVIFLMIPKTFHFMVHGLHYQGYALSILLLQVTFSLYILKNDKVSSKSFIGIGLFSFIQGWLSFDYFFLSSFFALPLLLIFKEKKQILKITVISLVAFGLAHFIHLIQVISFYGALEKALSDIFGAASKRQSGNGTYSVGAIKLISDYLSFHTVRSKMFGFNLTHLFALIIIKQAFISYRLKRVELKPIYVMLCALITSSLWVLVMKQHASVHTGFIPRHYYLFYFYSVLMLFWPSRNKI